MSRVTVDASVSLDGFSAGPGQSLETPLGAGGEDLHTWMFEQPEENAAERAAILEPDAYVMGRNMFGPPGGGEWDASWRGWWGEEPPYHAPVFVVTHHDREPVEMEGGTTFHFVTDGIESALARAREAAGDSDVGIAGGAATVAQYLRAGLVDELRLHVAPIMLGSGERLLDGLLGLQFEPVSARKTELVTHLVYRPVGSGASR